MDPLLTINEQNTPAVTTITEYFDQRRLELADKIFKPNITSEETEQLRGRMKEIREFLHKLNPGLSPVGEPRFDSMSGKK